MNANLKWLASSSVTAELIRKTDWSQTSLGPIQHWSASLKTSINLILDSKFPMYLWWGPDFINIYNDAYIDLAGPKNHPTFFGRPAKEMWSEIWPTLESFCDEVKATGRSLLYEDTQLPLERKGNVEEAYFTFSYGPARNEHGEIEGIHCTCFETTDKIFAKRQLESAINQLKGFFLQSPIPMVILLGENHKFTIVNPPYERLVGRNNLEGKTVAEVFDKEDIQPFISLLDSVFHTSKPFIGTEVLLRLADDNGELVDHWIDFGYHPYKDENGKTIGVMVIATDSTNQVLSKKQIEKSHREFQELANYMPQIVWTANPAGELDYFNEVWFKYSNSTYVDNIGNLWVQYVHPDDLILTVTNWHAALEKQSAYTNEFRLRRADGEYRWHIARAYPVRDAFNNITKWIGTNTDIHEAKTFTYDLASEKLKFETLFADAATSMALLKGPDLIFENVNPSYHQLFLDRIEIGKSILEVVPELKDQPFAKLLQGVFQTGIAYREDEAHAYLRRTKDGPLEERFFRQSYTQVKDANGNPYGVFIHATDVTNEVIARRQLEYSRNRMNLAVEAAHMGTWHIDLKTMEVNTSDEFMKIFDFGFVGGDIFTEISRLMHPDDVAEVNRIWQKSVADKEPYIHEYRIVTEAGVVKWVHSRGQATYDKNGTPMTLSGVLMDITDKKLADEKLNSLANSLSVAVAIRDEFMSIASHELKTPLTSMRLQTQSMQRSINRGVKDALAPERVTRLIDNNDKQVTRLIRLVDDMLDVSRIESGKLSVNFETLDLKEIILDVYAQLKEQFENAGSEAKVELMDGAVGQFDRARLEQVITNLLTNAIRYGKGKPIAISLHNDEKKATVKIKDHGIGISPENFEKVFGRFERIISPHEINGLGLGLFISKQIVLAHQGKIWIESELGKGSTFIVEFPYEKAP